MAELLFHTGVRMIHAAAQCGNRQPPGQNSPGSVIFNLHLRTPALASAPAADNAPDRAAHPANPQLLIIPPATLLCHIITYHNEKNPPKAGLFCAEGGDRTPMMLPSGILSPLRLPVPPLRRYNALIRAEEFRQPRDTCPWPGRQSCPFRFQSRPGFQSPFCSF